MTMKRILHCTLMFVVLITAGCDLIFGPNSNTPPPNSNSQPTEKRENTIDFEGAARILRDTVSTLNSPPKNGTVKLIKEPIDNAIRKLEEKEREKCTACKDDTKSGAAEVWKSLTALSKTLKPEDKIADLEDGPKEKLQEALNVEAGKLTALSTAPLKSAESPQSGSSIPKGDLANTETGENSWLWNTAMLALKIAAGVIVVILLAATISYLWKRSWRTVESNVAQLLKGHLAATREAQTDYAPKLSSLSSAQSEMSSRLNDLDNEVRSLARLVRESLATRRNDHNPPYGGNFNYQSHIESVSPKDEPEFPVSAVDYLGKMNRFANVVRPDFQNGILVNDPDGDGELVLIRDSRDDALFVVPRATQFQTKQDFYTYYQKYYDCVRPSAGDVWIIGPAVVEKVSGGWQLREKGMLEIR